MISKQAVQSYLNRSLDSWDFLKSWTPEETDIAISQLNPRPLFSTELFYHQKLSFLVGIHLPEFLYILDMGLGKTLTTLAILSYWKQCGASIRTLVLVPNLVHIESWRRECAERAPNLICVPLYAGVKEERLRTLLETEGDVYVINYDGLLTFTTNKIPTDKKKTRLVADSKKLATLTDRFKQLVLDECDEVANHQTVTYKVVKEFARVAEARFGLSGHPFNRDATKLWGQFYLIDHGKTLGSTLGIFRESFFETKFGFWGGVEYQLKKGMEDKLHQTLKHRSIRFRDDECQKLPEVIYSDIETRFTKEGWDFYTKSITNARAAKGNFRLLENVYVNMRQTTSGYVTVKDKELGLKDYIEFTVNPKLDALCSLVSTLPEGRKMLVFHEYVKTGELITTRLKELKVPHVWLYGGTKDKTGTLNRFLEDPKYRIMVLNNDTGSKGLNLQVANFLVFFESPDASDVRSQAEKRIHRTGQTRTCFIYDIRMRKSLDYKIKKCLEEGKSLFKAVIEGQESLEEED
jgi:SNF2 family DNA or RNA helicase